MLLSNSYRIKDGRIKQSDISSFYLQKPNKRVLGVRIYAHAYNFGTLFRDSSWMNRLFTETIGEPPVIYDSTMVDKTFANIRQHLENMGYFDVELKARITEYPKMKALKVTYLIYPHEPYRIGNIKLDIKDPELRAYAMINFNKRIIHEGDIFSVEDLKLERERLVNSLQNAGYYYFNKEQVLVEADSNNGNHRIDLNIKLLPMKVRSSENPDSIIERKNRRYRLRNIYIYPEMNEMSEDLPTDTTIIVYSQDKHKENRYIFIHKKDFVINPKVILNALFIKPNNFYKKSDFNETYRALSSLNVYRFINIKVSDVSEDTAQYGQLDCIVQLSRSPRFDISTDTQLKNTGGDLGIEQGFGFTNRNTFKNAEILKVGLRGALEVQSATNVQNPEPILKIFNTFEAGINVSLELPRFLAPIRRERFSRYFKPKTRIKIGYNFQKRPDYTRTIVDINFGYFWQPSYKTNHLLNPIEISGVKIYPEPEFQDIIDKYNDPRIKYSYQDHLVLGMSYAFIFHERIGRQRKPYHYFFGKFELGGLPYSWFSTWFGNEKDSLGQHWVGGLPYTQFFRLEADYRYYLPSWSTDIINVFRANFGIGVPMGGSVTVPFEKSFYIGGDNSLRAWVLGTLGPGAHKSSGKTFEMTGDMKIEFNYELRFGLGGDFEGAFFVDAGNIWLLKESKELPNGVFHFDTFIPQFAADFGVGIRYDISFLVIRFDVALPMYQPYRNPGDRWSVSNENSKVIAGWNFAIGYPF
jgi:outer membrane protein assembly factor BamA